MSHQDFFFIVFRVEKLDTRLYEWFAEADSGGVVLAKGNGGSIQECLRDARSILGAAHGVELRYDGYCAGTFSGTELVEQPAKFADKAAEVTMRFKSVHSSLY